MLTRILNFSTASTRAVLRQRKHQQVPVSFIGLCICLVLSACKPATIQITPPQPTSAEHVPGTTRTINMSIVDGRDARQKQQMTRGELTGELVVDGEHFDLVPFLRKHVKAELEAQGYRVVMDNRAENRLTLQHFTLHTERESAYEPFILWAALQGDWREQNTVRPLVALAVKEHYPVMTYKELNQPLYSDALDLLVKELANKISRQVVGERKRPVGDELPKKTSAVYRLGFSQNAEAVTPLMELTQNENPDIRRAAIYSLGLLPAEAYFPTFVSLYTETDNAVDKLLLLRTLFELSPQRTHNWIKQQSDSAKSSDLFKSLRARTMELYEGSIPGGN